jgi:dTDP-4-dehydrorhamnose reductase
LILILEAERPLAGLARGLEAAGRTVKSAFVDLGSMKSVRAVVAEAKPEAVIACGLEDPLACEEEPGRAFLWNAEGAIHLAAAALEFKAVPVMISTAAVFGDAGTEHDEASATDPRTAYAKSKLQGETFLLRAAKSGLVIRVGHVLADGLGEERAQAKSSASSREIVSVIGAYDLGIAIDRLLAEKVTGVVHAACGNPTEHSLWSAFAPVEETQRVGGAGLICDRLARIVTLRSWREALADAARFPAPVVEVVRTLLAGESFSGDGEVAVSVLSGKVVVELGEDRILKAGASLSISGTYRVVAIDPSSIIVR